MPENNKIQRFQLYGEESLTNLPDSVHLERIPTRSRLHNWVIAPHRHPSIFQVHFVERGSTVIVADGQETHASQPALILTPCDCPHAFNFTDDVDGWVLSVAETLVHDQRLAIKDKERFMSRNNVVVLTLEQDAQRAQLIGLLLAEMDRKRERSQIIIDDTFIALLASLFSLIEDIIDETTPQSSAELTPRRALYRRFLALVEQEYRSEWKVADYANALGTSQATLTRACRDIAEKPPSELVLDRKILEAKRSLSFTSASVSQIANNLGYMDPSYFARSFLRHTGMTASAFRKGNTQLEPKRARRNRSKKDRADTHASPNSEG